MNTQLKLALRRSSLALTFAAALAGCGSDDPSETGKAQVETYSRIVHATYQDSLTLARALDDAISAFLSAPSEESLSSAREAWYAAREPYLLTEVYRFYEGPIDDPEDGPEGLINAWPLDEAYIDYVEDRADAGIINDPSVSISAETLLALNEAEGEESIATGYHAIEFLLWGQDLDPNGPGARPYTDYVTDGSGTAENQDRRGEYLRTVSALLVEHLEGLVTEWSPSIANNYRAEFEAGHPDDSLERIFTGMIVLSGFESGRERLQPALLTGDQEDEHSCFSDNTHRDMVQDVQGILNVWNGSYERLDGSEVEGASLHELVAKQDADLAEELDSRIGESLALAEALEPPFDREIHPDNAEGRARVEALIDSLQTQEELLSEVFDLLGFTVPETD